MVRAILGLCLLWLATARPEAAGADPLRRVVSLNLCTDQWLVLLAPEKIVALSPLAHDATISYVAARAAEFPIIRASAEAVMALHPDMVLGARFGARTTLALLERAGVRVERLDLPTDFPGIRAAIRATAELLRVPDRAFPLIAAMDAALPPPSPPITALVWQPRGWTSGPGQFMDAVVRAAGMIDTGTGARVGMEALLRDPPSVLVLSEATAGASLATEMLEHPAVRHIPMRAIPTPLTICPIPFSAEAVKLLTRSSSDAARN